MSLSTLTCLLSSPRKDKGFSADGRGVLNMSVLWAHAEPDQLWKAVPSCREASSKIETSRSFHHGEDC